LSARPTPTNLAPLPELLADAQSLGRERHLGRAKRGLSTLASALLWLVLAWRGSGRPDHLERPACPARARCAAVWRT
jgi:hypothetical protein